MTFASAPYNLNPTGSGIQSKPKAQVCLLPTGLSKGSHPTQRKSQGPCPALVRFLHHSSRCAISFYSDPPPITPVSILLHLHYASAPICHAPLLIRNRNIPHEPIASPLTTPHLPACPASCCALAAVASAPTLSYPPLCCLPLHGSITALLACSVLTSQALLFHTAGLSPLLPLLPSLPPYTGSGSSGKSTVPLRIDFLALPTTNLYSPAPISASCFPLGP